MATCHRVIAIIHLHLSVITNDLTASMLNLVGMKFPSLAHFLKMCFHHERMAIFGVFGKVITDVGHLPLFLLAVSQREAISYVQLLRTIVKVLIAFTFDGVQQHQIYLMAFKLD